MYLKGAHERVVYRHHCSCIVELAAVVRCREERHQLSLCKELVAIFDYLMSSRNKWAWARTLEQTCISNRDHACIRIWRRSLGQMCTRRRDRFLPSQQRLFQGPTREDRREVPDRERLKMLARENKTEIDTCWPNDSSNLLHWFKIGTESAVAAEDFFIDNCGKWQTVEAICERFPKLIQNDKFQVSQNKVPWYYTDVYIRHRSRRFCWWKRTRGFLAAERSSLGIWKQQWLLGSCFSNLLNFIG